MKSLDLQVFEKHPDVDAYRFGPSFTPYAIVAQEKRFTDAELAAEYFNAEASRRTMELHMEGVEDLPEFERRWEIQDRFYDFATLPHYDEQ